MKKLFLFNLVGVSSCASQLGFLIAQRNYQYKHSNQYIFGEIYILFRPILTIGNLQTLNFLDKNAFCRLLGVSQLRFLSILSKGFIVKQIFIFCTLLLSVFASIIDVIIWEPKPNWLPTNFSFFNIYLTLPYQKIVYYGDGFMQQILDNSPFWLSNGNQSLKSKPLSANTVSIFLFSLIPLSSSNINSSYSISSVTVLEFFAIIFKHNLISRDILQFLEQLSDSIDSSNKYLLIFPTTTFYETNRSLLADELSLYLESLSLIHDLGNELILVKLHPRTDKTKLAYFLAESSPLFDINSFNDLIIDPITATVIPMELIIYYLTSVSSVCNEEDISVAVSSTAALSCASLFNNLKFRPLFGHTLVEKYLLPDYVSSRLRQEALLQNFISHYI